MAIITTIANAIIALAKIIPQVKLLIETVADLYLRSQLKNIDRESDAKMKTKAALLDTLNDLSDNEVRLELTKLIYDIDHPSSNKLSNNKVE